jgi:DNA-binding transcriptional LysR family regulator
MRVNLSMDLLRSFVTIVDTGSIVRASEHIFLTQSAISLQMKRLAEMVQQPLFRRHQGAMTLTPAGEVLLASAREILALNDNVLHSIGKKLSGPVRVGMVQDFADAILSNVLTGFKRSNPDVRMEIRVGTSSELRELIDSELLDIALYLSDTRGPTTVATAPMAWLGSADLLAQPTLPIALMSRPCIFRDACLAGLEDARQSYSVALETPSISVLRAAVESGLALTCRTSAFSTTPFIPMNIGQIALPEVAYNLILRKGAHSTASNLAELLRSELAAL